MGEEVDADSDMRIVSHIPTVDPKPSASVSSLSSAAESSLSSAQFHSAHTLAKSEDQSGPPVAKASGTAVTVGSNDSSSSAAASANSFKAEASPVPAESTVQVVTQFHGFTRPIAFVSGYVPDGRESKRLRSHSTGFQPLIPQVRREGRLLFTAADASVLSPLHIFVRQQIEVFEASENDLKQPAPGRRIPIQLNQGKCGACPCLLITGGDANIES